MKPPLILGSGAQFFIAALVVLGLFGGSLILAHSGFETSSKRGADPVFVPLPQAYIIAALMYAMSAIAAVALLRHHKASNTLVILSTVLYAAIAWALKWLIITW
jgi:hypothetical protein